MWKAFVARATALVVALQLVAFTAIGSRPPAALQSSRSSVHCEPVAGIDGGGAGVVDRTDRDVRVRLSMGQRSTGGYAVSLRSKTPLQTRDGIVVLGVNWSRPAPDAMVTQVITRPCLEVAIERAYRGVEFIDQDGVLRGRVHWGETPQ